MEEAVENTLMEDWERIKTAYPLKHVLKPSFAVINGVSSRLGPKRLTRMMNGTAPTTLRDIILSAKEERVKALRVMADVNHEQTSAAFKVTMVGNVTAPLAFLALLHQILPGGLSKIWSFFEGESQFFIYYNLVLFIFVALIVAAIIFYALANLGQARDIKNLIDIYAAERGIFFGMEDSETA